MCALGQKQRSDWWPLISALPPKADVAQQSLFCNMCVAVHYFSPRRLCRFDLGVKAISIRRRIASDQLILTCWLSSFYDAFS
jgi:hypothetical protein